MVVRMMMKRMLMTHCLIFAAKGLSRPALFLVAALGLSAISSAFAQSEHPAAPAEIMSQSEARALAVRAATSTPAIGEEVLDAGGAVSGVYFVENRICTVQGCRVFIFDKRSGALIHNDGVWSSAYAATGRGRQVIRIKAFMAVERPKPAPSDKALETALRIRKVIRPTTDGQKKKTP